ncbi:GMC family oxidoreductase [Massilia sp. HP4]|uniref:GMC family oxidoreductase n=1 Tax=Massilia sp. HP4 TaxID=2562316 RepID=UPI0010BFA653|nr:GMC family oxidoreductase N-terminal domain-containing protein [Massilia sp. HP4]
MPLKNQLLASLEASLITGRIDRRSFIRFMGAAGLFGTGVTALADSLDAIRSNQEARGKNLLDAYDYIVCGTGSAGCALVHRLAADPDAKILVVEAGGWDTAPAVADPRVWFTNLGTERDWGDVAVRSPHVNNRAIPEHMGRVVGGGSSINATIWARPFRKDLDYWVDVTGDQAWGYENALSIYRRIENWQGKPDARYRGQGGPVWCQPAHDPSPLAPAMLAACSSLGLPVLDDLNGAREERESGFALMNQIIRDGQRHSLAKAYLYPVLGQPNVTLLVNTHVDRLSIVGNTVEGIEFVQDGKPVRIRAAREVILATGAINTPKLLMLSGIGDQQELKKHGIKTIVHSPEVGKNFQDHILHGACLWEASSKFELRNSGASASGFMQSAKGRAGPPDINLVQIELPYASEVVAKAYSPPATSWALCAGLVGPKSRGHIALRSAKASDRPVVHANFLSHPDDVKALAVGIEMARDIGNAGPLRQLSKREVAPAKKLAGKEMTDFIRNGATTYFHESGTCRMGNDARAVVDSRLRVNGMRKLRIADSSIMPRIVSVATMATCALIGERMAEILKTEA